jgi:cytochrome c biogenesis protein CcmG/thiol:disulfide interchange protein DsbE
MGVTISRRVVAAAVSAASVLVLVACGSQPAAPAESDLPAPELPAKASPELRTLVRQANQLLDGGTDAFEARLERLRGLPVVVNQWASWCGPCRFEFPFFQHLARKYASRVAFLGVNTEDSRGDAADFLREYPVPYPHYYDKDASVARLFGGGRAWPTTAFYNADGKLVQTHLGAYASQAKLDEDLRRYALRG